MPTTLRAEGRGDEEAVGVVHRRAFGRDDEARLVDALRAGGHGRVSLVAVEHDAVVGHVLLSAVAIAAAGGAVAGLALAPLAVLPERQRRGIGSALVREALGVARAEGHRVVLVLGDPAFYARFGFSVARAAALRTPYPRDAFQALELVPGALAAVAGTVVYPAPFASR